jgi:hypothetical protein
MFAAHAALHRGATPGRRVEHFCDPWPSEPLFPPGSEQSLAFLNAGEGFRARLDTAARRIGTTRLGALDFATVNAMALDPVEWPNFAALLGATKVVALYEAGELAWWPGSREPVASAAAAGSRAAVARSPYRPFARQPHAALGARCRRAVLHRPRLRPSEAAQLIARALGLTEAPRVAA